MSVPRGIQRFGATAPSPGAALLCYWYGLSGACGAILLELYLHPRRGCRVADLLTMLESRGEPQIIKVYVCYIRAALSRTFDGADVIETIPGPVSTGPYASGAETRYRLRSQAVADVRECLEIAHEQLSKALGRSVTEAA